MEREYHKLVRDRIPEIIRARGDVPVVRALGEAEYRAALERKLLEECREVLAAEGADRIEELADVLEVIRALAAAEGATLREVCDAAEAKRLARGAFAQRILLERILPQGEESR